MLILIKAFKHNINDILQRVCRQTIVHVCVRVTLKNMRGELRLRSSDYNMSCSVYLWQNNYEKMIMSYATNQMQCIVSGVCLHCPVFPRPSPYVFVPGNHRSQILHFLLRSRTVVHQSVHSKKKRKGYCH